MPGPISPGIVLLFISAGGLEKGGWVMLRYGRTLPTFVEANSYYLLSLEYFPTRQGQI
jgi:hypothetical protein